MGASMENSSSLPLSLPKIEDAQNAASVVAEKSLTEQEHSTAKAVEQFFNSTALSATEEEYKPITGKLDYPVQQGKMSSSVGTSILQTTQLALFSFASISKPEKTPSLLDEIGQSLKQHQEAVKELTETLKKSQSDLNLAEFEFALNSDEDEWSSEQLAQLSPEELTEFEAFLATEETHKKARESQNSVKGGECEKIIENLSERIEKLEKLQSQVADILSMNRDVKFKEMEKLRDNIITCRLNLEEKQQEFRGLQSDWESHEKRQSLS